MQENTILEYFQAEKMESLLFMLLGIAGLLIGGMLWRNGDTYKNMLYPLVVVGMIQLIVGGSVFLKTDKQITELTHLKNENPTQFKQREFARMSIVNKNFQYYKAFEIFLICLGIILSYLYPFNMSIYSVSIGLILESALMLVLDLFAEKRAIDYLNAIMS